MRVAWSPWTMIAESIRKLLKKQIENLHFFADAWSRATRAHVVRFDGNALEATVENPNFL